MKTTLVNLASLDAIFITGERSIWKVFKNFTFSSVFKSTNNVHFEKKVIPINLLHKLLSSMKENNYF